MSEPLIKDFTGQNSELDGIHPIYMPNNARTNPNIISIGNTPSRMLFDPTDIPDNVRTIHEKLYWSKFRIGWYSPDYMPNNVRTDPNIISSGNTPSRMLFDPTDTPDNIRTIHTGQNSELDCIHPIYMLNNVRTDPTIISLGNTPSRMLFDPTDTPYSVRSIHNKF